MPFHRYSVPAYFGGLPAGYDYINNAISGTPANADSAKVGGPNAGTYFIAFGEDATSADANRPAQALAQNTDFIDNLLHRDIALPVRSSDGTGAPTSSVTLVGPGVFMGLVGAQLVDLFRVTDTNDDDLDVAGTQVIVTSATDLGAPPVLQGGGFSNGNVTIDFNIPIPSAQGYRIYYGQRTNLATFPADGLTSTRVRNLTDVEYQVEELFRLLHGDGQAWNAAWESTIYDLTTRGLQGMYSLDTTGFNGPVNTAGAGARAFRSAQALTMASELSIRNMPDQFNALWLADATPDGEIISTVTSVIGSMGFVALTDRWQTALESPASPMVSSFATLNVHPEPLAPSGGDWYWTRIPAEATATITAIPFTNAYTLVLDPSSISYFWRADVTTGTPKRTALMSGIDLFTLTLAGGVEVTVRLVSLTTSDSTAKTCVVTSLDGSTLTEFGTLPLAIAAITWVTPSFLVGVGAAEAKQAFAGNISSGLGDNGLFVVIPPPVAGGAGMPGPFTQLSITNKPAAFFGAGTTNVDQTIVVGWGAFIQRDIAAESGGAWEVTGSLGADGSVRAGLWMPPTLVATTGADSQTRGNLYSIGATGTVALDIDHFDYFEVNLTAADVAVTILFHSLHGWSQPVVPGRIVRVVVQDPNGGGTIDTGSFVNGTTIRDYEYPYTAVPELQGVAGAHDIYTFAVQYQTGRSLISVERF